MSDSAVESALPNLAVDSKIFGQAMLNILADLTDEKVVAKDTELAMLNILGDAAEDMSRARTVKIALLNVLDDFAAEKAQLESTQKAFLNILADFDVEKERANRANVELLDEIAQRKRVEKELADHRSRLEDIVAARTIELQETNRNLVTANKELEGFSYSTSHVLRAPLRAIDGFSRILLEEHFDKLDDEGKRLLGVVRSNAREMDEQIDGILKYLRLGWDELSLVPIRMGDVVRSVFEQLEPTTRSRKIIFQLTPLPDTFGDTGMIQLVWTHLLENAVKFTVLKPKARIEVGALPGEGETIYFVRDDGAGFDMRFSGKLFGVFDRLHGSEFAGNGMGLAIVRRILLRHGGRVWAEGKPNEGATFYFALPTKERGYA
jgi:light-regulated signal transduction histidine kinase (bacteriophytochrome)